MKDFASDNHAGAHPDVLAAIAAANEGHAGAYGGDPWTERVEELFRSHFGPDARGFPVFNGSGANVTALDSLTRSFEAVICTETAHMNVDECGAPERDRRRQALHRRHRAREARARRPRPLGGPPRRRPPRPAAHRLDHPVVRARHRLHAGRDPRDRRRAPTTSACSSTSTAPASRTPRPPLGVSLKELTTDCGVDVVSFGATKNGLAFGDSVVFLRPELADGFEFVRKQLGQLASKMRFLSAQFEALLGGDLWLENARHANAMAARLAGAVRDLPGLEIVHPVEVNAVFARIPREAIDTLLEELPGEPPFHVWDEHANVVRWMCAWDTTAEDVDEFAAAVETALRR